ncbi:hypothetical protein, conserved [Babesia ovata]|uniref:Uncharacterized protein n=1 Tax=Babesia ovata TaxID=189622 RepID=A0A2H6K6D6_9APIC|nr:uncharacterized protein BOVATA_000410 [Babesia ovata]GBE58548.1 hypothetical protein, conserved [Babesia ovata]
MVYSSLTEAPRNLKEGIDWLMALKGTDDENGLKAMSAALYDFLAQQPVGKMELPALEEVKLISKEFLEQKELKYQPFVEDLLGRFNKPMNKNLSGCAKYLDNSDESDHENVVKSRGVKPKDIAKNIVKVVDGCAQFLEKIKNPGQYESAYSSEATWDTSCSKDPEACVVILVGIAPMLYAGLRSLRIASNTTPLSRLGCHNKKIKLVSVLKALGYEEAERRAKMSGSDVFKALKSVSHEMLVTLYDIAGFWAFY